MASRLRKKKVAPRRVSHTEQKEPSNVERRLTALLDELDTVAERLARPTAKFEYLKIDEDEYRVWLVGGIDEFMVYTGEEFDEIRRFCKDFDFELHEKADD